MSGEWLGTDVPLMLSTTASPRAAMTRWRASRRELSTGEAECHARVAAVLGSGQCEDRHTALKTGVSP